MSIKDQAMSENQELAELTESFALKMDSLAEQIQLVIPATPEETWQEIVRLEEQALVNTAKKGLLLLTLKENSQHI